MGIYDKLFSIQKQLKCNKANFNENGKYKFRTTEDILSSVKPILNELGLVLLMCDEPIYVGNRNYIQVSITLIDKEKNDIIKVSSSAREDEERQNLDGSQITGSTISYARKMALSGLFAIDDTKDSDVTNTRNTPKTKEIKTNDKDPASLKWTHGPNSGKTIREIYNSDRKFFNWIEANTYDVKMKAACIAMRKQEEIQDYPDMPQVDDPLENPFKDIQEELKNNEGQLPY